MYFTDSPVCKSSPRKIGSVVGNNITISCDVDAYPRDGFSFQWWFLGNGIKTQRRMLYVHSQTMTHRVESNEDFGTIYCQARNDVGWQNQPCMFNIHPGGIIAKNKQAPKNNQVNILQIYRVTRSRAQLHH